MKKPALVLSALLSVAPLAPHVAQADNRELKTLKSEVKLEVLKKMERILLLQREVQNKKASGSESAAKQLSKEEIDKKNQEIASLRNALTQLGLNLIIIPSEVDKLKEDLGIPIPPKKVEDDYETPPIVIRPVEKRDFTVAPTVNASPFRVVNPTQVAIPEPKSTPAAPVAKAPAPAPTPVPVAPKPAEESDSQEVKSGDDLLELLK